MRDFRKTITASRLQIILGIVVFILNFLSNLQYDPTLKSFVFALLAMMFYFVIIYGNAFWLIPQFYNRQKIVVYVLLVLLLLLASIYLRSVGAVLINSLFGDEKKAHLTTGLVLYSTFSAIWIFLVSILCRLAMDFFKLNKTQSEIKAEKAQTELLLLKQQLHPHFLFNTLNNIYYVAQKESPDSADLIERLSGIMRYFIEESKKEKVFLKDEIELLQSYIELESIRMRYETRVDFKVDEKASHLVIPPLLLLPLVENIFKHGIDKRSRDNFAEISLDVNREKLIFTTSNNHYQNNDAEAVGKTGLANLRKRLKLYYGEDFKLITDQKYGVFMAILQIPVYDN